HGAASDRSRPVGDPGPRPAIGGQPRAAAQQGGAEVGTPPQGRPEAAAGQARAAGAEGPTVGSGKAVVIGTAGHIDHGKSSLALALTGTDPDRLKEEKARGITIDLGFAHASIGGHEVAFVDVPGHERFVKNMLAGVGGIDAVLLVIAADESVMP